MGNIRLFRHESGYIPSFNILLKMEIITSPPERVARYCFHPVCLSVCVCVCVCICVYLCVRPIFWYFIYRLFFRRDIDLSEIYTGYL